MKDEAFANDFSITCAQILRKEPYAVRYVPDRDRYETTVPNTSFCRFLEQSLSKLNKYVQDYQSGFVRGLANSDGCPAVTTTRKRGRPWFFVQVVVATSTSLRLLSYVRMVLRERFQIESTLVYKGKPYFRPYKNVVFHSSKRVFDLRISKFDDVRRFSSEVGFKLKRKQIKLESAIAVRERYGSGIEAVREWKDHWVHGRTEWVPRGA